MPPAVPPRRRVSDDPNIAYLAEQIDQLRQTIVDFKEDLKEDVKDRSVRIEAHATRQSGRAEKAEEQIQRLQIELAMHKASTAASLATVRVAFAILAAVGTIVSAAIAIAANVV